MNRLPHLSGLYAITDPKLTPDEVLLDKVEAALVGGTRIVQYRDKSQDHSKRKHQAQSLKTLCEQHRATFIVNDDVELALAVNAHGVHLGLEDIAISAAREMLGENAIIGATCHGDIANAHTAIAEGADYVAFGRFYPSTTKPDAPQASLDELSPLIAELSKPAVAIGGITLANAPQLRAAGFAMVAVIADIFGQNDIAGHCHRYAELFQD